MQYPILTCGGVKAIALQPPADLVISICDKLRFGVAPWDFNIPSSAEVAWNGSQRAWMLPVLSGAWRTPRGEDVPPIAARLYERNPTYLRWVVEAYMTDVRMPDGSLVDYETTTDGASWFPDPPWNRTHFVKCWIAVGHYCLFDRNHVGMPDVLGHRATFEESVDYMSACMRAEGELSIWERRGVRAAVGSPLAFAWWNKQVKGQA